MRAPLVPLGNVAAFVRGVTYKPVDLVENFSAGSLVCMRTANIQTQLDQTDLKSIPAPIVKSADKRLLAGDILVSTANSWNLVGKCCWVPALEYDAVPGGFIAALRADREQVEPRYLYHWFNSPRTQDLARNCGRQTTNISNMDLNRCLAIQIPLPPLPEQRRIAAILDKADALRAKRRQAIAKLDLLLQSVFLEMFGDPVTNPKGWPMVHVGDAFSAFVGGKNVECPDSGSSPYRILKVSAVTKTVFMPDQSKLAPDGLIPASEHIVRNGDLLFSRANTAELVAATAYVWETPPNLVLPDKIWRMVLRDESKLIPLFAWELFKNRAFRDELSKRSSGTSGSMKNISKAKLMLVPMPLPPLELQNKLALLSRRLHQQRAWLERQQSGLDQVQTAIATSAFAS